MTGRMKIFIIAVSLSSLCAFTKGSVEYLIAVAEKFAVLGKLNKTMLYYDKAIAQYPDSPLPYKSRAFFFLKRGLRDQAIADFSKEIDLLPTATEGYLSRGLVYSEMGEKEKASADFSKACALGEQSGCTFLGETGRKN